MSVRKNMLYLNYGKSNLRSPPGKRAQLKLI